MFAQSSSTTISTTALFAAAMLLGGCGGGGTATTPAIPSTPATPATPATPETIPHDHDGDDDHDHEHADDTPALPAETPQNGSAAGSSAASGSETITMASAWTPLVQGTINNTPYWPVWWGTGKPVEGVNCLISGAVHKHTLVSIYKDGKRLGFPDGVGRVHAGCYHAYELHVHDVTGIIHMESDVPKNFKLGHWFTLWNLPLGRNGTAGLPGPARFYLIEAGKITRYDGNPYDIDLVPHREVLIVTGTNLTVAPKYQWPAGI